MRNEFRLTTITVFLLAVVASMMGEADCDRALVAYGDANGVGTFSGIPYFFLRAGRRIGLFRGGSRFVRSDSVAAGRCGTRFGRLPSTVLAASCIRARTFRRFGPTGVGPAASANT
jgi:hypothetical protein